MAEESAPGTSRPERVLRSFASLFSSALTMTGDTPESLTTSSSDLPRFIASTVSDDSDCCTFPCLMLRHTGSSSLTPSTSSLEETAALYLARPVNVTRMELEAVPNVLLENISESFMSLVDSRLRSSLAALMRQPDTQNESAITRAVVGLLAVSSDNTNSSSPISPTAVVTSFRVLPVCDLTQSGDHVAPLVMEAVIDLSILSQLVTITFVAPGTIQGSFVPSSSNCLLSNVEVVLDTVALLQSMMKQARSAVREAVVIASGVASNLLVSPPEEADSSAAQREEPTHFGEATTASNGEGTSTNTDTVEGASTMQPPPRRLPESSGGSTPDLPSEDAHEESTENKKNAPWGEGSIRTGNGLSLLTAAAIGLKHAVMVAPAPDPKRSRTNGHSPPPRKATSCPGL